MINDNICIFVERKTLTFRKCYVQENRLPIISNIITENIIYYYKKFEHLYIINYKNFFTRNFERNFKNFGGIFPRRLPPTHSHSFSEWRAHVCKRWRTGIRMDTHVPTSHGALENGKSDLLNWQDKQRSLPGLPRIDSIKTNDPGNANGELCTLRVNPSYYSSRRPSKGSRSMTSSGKFISSHVWKKISRAWTKMQMQMKVHERLRLSITSLFLLLVGHVLSKWAPSRNFYPSSFF